MMNKLFLILFSVIVIFVVSCTPPPPGGAGEETALAGQAVNSSNCKNTPVDNCVETAKGITYTKSVVTRSLNDSCSGTRLRDYSCFRKNKFRTCDIPCSSGTSCVVDSTSARCAPPCGNGRVDAGETCSSCARDVSCVVGQECQSGVCVVVVNATETNITTERNATNWQPVPSQN